METFKRALAFIALLGGILLGAEIFIIVRNEYLTYRFKSEFLNNSLSFLIIASIYGIMIGSFVYVGGQVDKFHAKRGLKRKKEDEERVKMVRSKITENILSKLSKDELDALMKNKDLINFNFLISYHQQIILPQENLLKEVEEIFKKKD